LYLPRPHAQKVRKDGRGKMMREMTERQEQREMGKREKESRK
jgi:hypothetical protein